MRKTQLCMMKMANNQTFVFASAVSLALLMVLLASSIEMREEMEVCTNTPQENKQDCAQASTSGDHCVDYVMSFETERLEIDATECVRLHFLKQGDQHFLATTFNVSELNISYSFDLLDYSSITFPASTPGTYAYTSTGMCQIDIPGAGSVVVDCAIFCGKTDNMETGFLQVNGVASAENFDENGNSV